MNIQRKPILISLAHPAAVALALLALSGCKIVSIQEDREVRERRSEGFDAPAYVAKSWDQGIIPELEKSAIEVGDLPAAGLDVFGKQHGRRAGEGSPWTFVLHGEGTVATIDRASRQGGITLTGAGPREIVLQTGPVVTESTVRDALPMFDFNDFADQMAFAAVSRALNEKALAGSAATAAKLAPGRKVRFLGVAHVSAEPGPLRILPFRLEIAN